MWHARQLPQASSLATPTSSRLLPASVDTNSIPSVITMATTLDAELPAVVVQWVWLGWLAPPPERYPLMITSFTVYWAWQEGVATRVPFPSQQQACQRHWPATLRWLRVQRGLLCRGVPEPAQPNHGHLPPSPPLTMSAANARDTTVPLSNHQPREAACCRAPPEPPTGASVLLSTAREATLEWRPPDIEAS